MISRNLRKKIEQEFSSKKTQKAMIERAAVVYTPGMTDETLWSLLQSKRNLVEPNNPKE